MIEHMFEAGVTYFDTAYPYHNGESEEMLAGALRKFPRDRFFQMCIRDRDTAAVEQGQRLD